MLWLLRLSGLLSSLLALTLLSPPTTTTTADTSSSSYRTAPPFPNSPICPNPSPSSPCDPSLIHIALTLDVPYLRGSIAAVHSILRHTPCPRRLSFHFLTSSDPLSNTTTLPLLLRSIFPTLRFSTHHFEPLRVRHLISSSVRHALDQPLNYARNYLPDLLPSCVRRVIYLDSDVVLLDDVSKLWATDLRSRSLAAPEYCHANFTSYFSDEFWADPFLRGTFRGLRRRPCYFNTGVMVVDVVRWRKHGYTRRLEGWMQVQRRMRIYRLGSLPPFLLVFAGRVAAVEHRWNQHGLGGDNVRGSCRGLHAGPVSLLHWSGMGKPWARLDSGSPCPLDALWAPLLLLCDINAWDLLLCGFLLRFLVRRLGSQCHRLQRELGLAEPNLSL